MEEKDDLPIAREPWQQVLQRGTDAPPDTTDARIRAAARRALAKHPARWWLPASLAASFVLAFMLVQSQFGEQPAPAHVTESDYAAAEQASAQEEPASAADADAYTPPVSEEPRAPAGKSLERASPPPAPPPRTTERRDAARPEPPSIELLSVPRSPPSPPPEAEYSAERESAVAGAETEAKAATSKDLSEVTVTGSRKRQSDLEMTTPVTGITAASVTRYRSPEAWYAAIEALRADGRTEEAERELERLEEAHPGWLKEHLAEQERQRNHDGR